jgi:hypothetical protein
MNQHSMIAPGTRRQAWQWSIEMTGMRSLTSLGGTSRRSSVRGVLGSSFRSESWGTEIVYRIALQKQPPWSWNGVFGSVFAAMMS